MSRRRGVVLGAVGAVLGVVVAALAFIVVLDLHYLARPGPAVVPPGPAAAGPAPVSVPALHVFDRAQTDEDRAASGYAGVVAASAGTVRVLSSAGGFVIAVWRNEASSVCEVVISSSVHQPIAGSACTPVRTFAMNGVTVSWSDASTGIATAFTWMPDGRLLGGTALLPGS